jgi:putative salt-induced outer membrane protein
MRLMRTTCVISALLFLASIAVPALSEDTPPKPLSGSAELSYVSTSGNTDTKSLGAGFALKYKPGLWTTDVTAAWVKAETDGVTTADKLTAAATLSRAFGERLEAYGRASYLANEFAGIDSNLGLEGGVFYKVLRGEKQSLDLGGGLGYVDEKRTTAEDRSFTSGNAFAKYKWKISKSADFTDELNYVYDFDNSNDWRYANSAAITASINSMFSMKAYWNVNVLNEPVPGFEKSDTTTGVSLVAKF